MNKVSEEVLRLEHQPKSLVIENESAITPARCDEGVPEFMKPPVASILTVKIIGAGAAQNDRLSVSTELARVQS